MKPFKSDERMLTIQNVESAQEIAKIAHALSSPTRVEILRLLNEKPHLMTEISAKLAIQPSSAAFHLKLLEDAGLIYVEYSTKNKGSTKWYSYSVRAVTFLLRDPARQPEGPEPYTASVQIGDYIEAEFNEFCGQASESRVLMINAPKDAFFPERHEAQYLWNKQSGKVTYAFSNKFADAAPVKEIAFSLEICSEANGYNDNFPSDITFLVNGVELCTWTCPGDYGDRYGQFTPSWWFPESTKYGLMTTVAVRQNGVYLNGNLVNAKISLSDLCVEKDNRITFTVAVKEDAKHAGGFNLFGEKFGNFNQAIVLTAQYK